MRSRTALGAQLTRSLSVYRSLFFSGLALRKRSAFRVRSTGAKVSGRTKKPRSVQEPANIIDTQKTQRQPKELVVILQENNLSGLPARLKWDRKLTNYRQ